MTNYRSFNDYLNRKRATHGAKFDTSDIGNELVLINHWRAEDRIKVEIHGEVLTGTVGISTGWKPVFLLMRRSNSVGSSTVLTPGSYKILAVKRGRGYVSC